ncbi:hypothetical protein RR48_01050 [Papilio machaon]|uniref:Uncharacterized protein n=1 Tax=Papilio machaon TaxID=76193 RepID=A0A0N0PEE4_PAPMA|nr:hypothetical protein RR48_01050 [Papilio machaon]
MWKQSKAGTRAAGVAVRDLRVSLSRCDSPMVLERRQLSDTDSGSCASLEAIGGEGMRSRSRSPPSRFWRKRSLTPEEGSAGARTTAPQKRGRGRPVTTGEYAGLARAKAELNAQREREIELQAEAELAAQVAERSRVLRARARAAMPEGPGEAASGEHSAEDLAGTVEAALDVIASVAKKSAKMKCQHIASVREAVATIGEAVRALRTRTESQEVAHLQAELAAMRAELEAVKRQAAAPPQMTREEILFMVDSRIAGIGDRLLPEPRLRPPLAADAHNAAAAAANAGATSTRREAKRAAPAPAVEPVPAPAVEPMPAPTPVPAATYAAAAKKGKGKGKKSLAAREAEAARKPEPAPPAPQSQPEEAWNVVTRKAKAPKQAAFFIL